MCESEGCQHQKVTLKFSQQSARGLSSLEVRKRWPRFCGFCSECGQWVTLYASYNHYLAGGGAQWAE
jgi:hypothetical protein